jgi:hypothetical protein
MREVVKSGSLTWSCVTDGLATYGQNYQVRPSCRLQCGCQAPCAAYKTAIQNQYTVGNAESA